MGIVSGAPTVYDPRAGIQEDPVVVLLKKVLGMKTVVEKKPDAGFMANEQVYVGGDSGIGGGGGGNVVVSGRPLGQAPADGYSQLGASTAYSASTQSLSGLPPMPTAYSESENINSSIINSEISYSSVKEVYEERWDNFIDEIGSILNDQDSFYGIEIGAIVGSEIPDERLDQLRILDDILLDLRVLNLESDRGMARRFRNADVYFAGLAELTGEVSFDDAMEKLLTATDEDRISLRKEILDYLKKIGIEVLDKSVIEANIGERTANQGTESMYSGSSMSIDEARRGSSSGAISANTLSQGFYRRGSIGSRRSSLLSSGSSMSIDKPSLAPMPGAYPYRDSTTSSSSRKSSRSSSSNSSSSRKSMFGVNAPGARPGVWKRKASSSSSGNSGVSSSSGNSSGVSYKPGNDTSKAFSRPSAKKKRFT